MAFLKRLEARVYGAPYGDGGELVEIATLRDAWAWVKGHLHPGQRLTLVSCVGLIVREWRCGPDGKVALVESSGRRRVG